MLMLISAIMVKKKFQKFLHGYSDHTLPSYNMINQPQLYAWGKSN